MRFKTILAVLLLIPALAFGQVFETNQGGTGTNNTPTLGDILLGQADGTYATSSLSGAGLVDGSGTTNRTTYWVDSNTVGATLIDYGTIGGAPLLDDSTGLGFVVRSGDFEVLGSPSGIYLNAFDLDNYIQAGLNLFFKSTTTIGLDTDSGQYQLADSDTNTLTLDVGNLSSDQTIRFPDTTGTTTVGEGINDRITTWNGTDTIDSAGVSLSGTIMVVQDDVDFFLIGKTGRNVRIFGSIETEIDSQDVIFDGGTGQYQFDSDIGFQALLDFNNLAIHPTYYFPSVTGDIVVATATTTDGVAMFTSNGAVTSVATTTVDCSGTVTCNQFVTIGSSPITLTGSGSGGGLASTTPWTTGDLTYVVDDGTITSVATGTLSTNATGLEFDNSRSVVGGSATLSLTSGYSIPLTASTSEWVAGPSSATDNALARFDTTTGKLLQNSLIKINDAGTFVDFGDNTQATIEFRGFGTGSSGTIFTFDGATGDVLFPSPVQFDNTTQFDNPAVFNSTINASSTSRFDFASTTVETVLENFYLDSLSTPAGTFLAVDAEGKVIATTTPSVSSGGASGLATTTPWNPGQLAYVVDDATVTGIATTSLTASTPLSLSQAISVIGPTASALTIQDAGADGSTKGASTFNLTDFDDNGSGLISIDYTNGQKASGAQAGFLSSAFFTSFSNKQDAISATYPVLFSSDIVSLDFGTTTSNTWAGTQTFSTATTTNLYASNTVEIQGVPFSLPPCAKNDAVLFNGTSLVCATQGTNFTFSIASFADGESTTQEIGTGTWKATSAMSYTASYNNGPPTTADVKLSINGGAYSTIGAMTGPNYTSGTNSSSVISYPASKDQTLRFRLDADDGVDTDTQTDTAVTFRNYVYTGCGTKANTYLEADIEALTGVLTNSINKSGTLNCGASEYIVHSYPASYTNMDEGADYETDGPVDFKFNSVALATIVDSRTLSITNSAGFAENYEVYVSTTANLGSGTFVANTSDQTIDPLYYGVTTTTSGYTEADVEGLGNNSITNDNTQVWNSVTASTGEYLLFAFPKRLGEVVFFVGGFQGGFQAFETVSVTNSNGFSEDYYVWRSDNSGLGSTVVETQ